MILFITGWYTAHCIVGWSCTDNERRNTQAYEHCTLSNRWAACRLDSIISTVSRSSWL